MRHASYSAFAFWVAAAALAAFACSCEPAPVTVPQPEQEPAAEQPPTGDAVPTLEESLLPSFDDTDDAVRIETDKLEELLNQVRIPPIVAERVEAIEKESVPELVAHLPRDDGFFTADTGWGGATIVSFSSAEYVNDFVAHLARVRRLLEIAEEERETVCSELRRALAEVNAGWVQAAEDARRAREKGDISFAWNQPEKSTTITASAAVYVLAELNDYQALELLMQAHAFFKQKPDPDLGAVVVRHAPVPQGTLLYGVYKLIDAYPDAALNPQARDHKNRFLQQASKILPPPEIKTVKRWNSRFRRYDPRIHDLFPPEPFEQITVWPVNSRSGATLSDMSGTISPEAQQLFEYARQFADSVR